MEGIKALTKGKKMTLSIELIINLQLISSTKLEVFESLFNAAQIFNIKQKSQSPNELQNHQNCKDFLT